MSRQRGCRSQPATVDLQLQQAFNLSCTDAAYRGAQDELLRQAVDHFGTAEWPSIGMRLDTLAVVDRYGS